MSTEEQKIARIRELKAEIAAITVDYDAEIKRLEDLLALKKSIAGPTFEKCGNLLAYYRLCEKIEGMLSPEDHKLLETWILCSTRHNAPKFCKVVPSQTTSSLMEFQSHRVRDAVIKHLGRRVYEDALQFASLMLNPWRFAEQLLQLADTQQSIEYEVRYRHLKTWAVSSAEFWNVLDNIARDLRRDVKEADARKKIDNVLFDLHSYYGFDMSSYYLMGYPLV